MVVTKGSGAQRVGSAWIHCSSPVARANSSIWSCVISAGTVAEVLGPLRIVPRSPWENPHQCPGPACDADDLTGHEPAPSLTRKGRLCGAIVLGLTGAYRDLLGQPWSTDSFEVARCAPPWRQSRLDEARGDGVGCDVEPPQLDGRGSS